MNDGKILELLRQKNYSKASEKLYRYYPVVKKLIKKNSGSTQDAEDIYQEALIILFRKANTPEFVLSSSLNTYLYSVCRYLWSDQLKKKNRNPLQPEPIEVVVEPPVDDSYSHLATEAFRQLGEKCRKLLLAFYVSGHSMKEIASNLGFSTEAVAKNQKYRCLEKAKENLKSLKGALS